MSQDQLTIESVTGVDVNFQIAGPGSRSYAFVIDWHIRFLLALAWYVVAAMILNGGASLQIPSERETLFTFVVLLPMMVLYFLYHPVLEVATRGRTPGKRIAGVRIVTRAGDIPGAGALLIRNIFRLVDTLPILYILGLIVTIVTRDHVRIGDMAAGTLLVVDHDSEGKSLARFDELSRQSQLDPHTADLIDELLQRWSVLASEKRTQFAVAILGRLDPNSDPARLRSLPDAELNERLKRLLERK